MGYTLSLLDKSLIQRGEAPAAALARTVALAVRAEQLGFRRYWLAEHHGFKTHASSAPEILIAYILARTSRIRVGAGGVMLQHYSPYKVAETFNLLAGLAPGRVDLGVGKAPGGFPLSTRALQAERDPARAVDFGAKFALLVDFMDGRGNAVAMPVPALPPERFLLGASVESAIMAGERGWRFAFAGQFNGDPGLIECSFAAYAKLSATKPIMCVSAFVAARQQEAQEKLAGLRVFKLHLPDGQSVNLGTPDQAAEYARQAGVDDYRIEETKPSVLAGTAEFVRRELDALHRHFGVDEFVIDIPVAGEAERFAAIELLAGEVFAAPAPALAS
jgi:luciferase family oxidoreductase group 1